MIRLRALVALCCALLWGCANNGPLTPPPAPTLTQIAAEWQTLATISMSPSAILNVGMTLDDQACYGWFDQQILNSQQTALGQSALGIGSGAAAIAGGPGGLASAGALGMTSALLGASQTNSPLGNYPVADLALEINMRQTWAAAAGVPATVDAAWRFVNSYHQLCTLGGISVAAAAAKMTAPVSVVPSPTIPISTTPVPTPAPPTPPPASKPAPPPSGTLPPRPPGSPPPVVGNPALRIAPAPLHVPSLPGSSFRLVPAPDGGVQAQSVWPRFAWEQRDEPPIVIVGAR